MTPAELEGLVAWLIDAADVIDNEGYELDSDMAAKAASALEALGDERERAFQTLECYGVPRERARHVAEGIAVLVTRMDKERDSLRAELEKQRGFTQGYYNEAAKACEERNALRLQVESVQRDAGRLPKTGAYAPEATCKHGVHPYGCDQGCDPHDAALSPTDKP